MPERNDKARMNRQPDRESRPQAGAPAAPTARRRSRRSTPPYNPGLQKLVAGKQAWSVPLDEDAKAKGFRGWHQRGYLPHFDGPGVTQFVTLRLADSLPASRRGEWEHLLEIEQHAKAGTTGAPAYSRLTDSKHPQSRSQTGAPPQTEAGRERRRKLEEYLDRGLGECWLGQPVIAKLTEAALRYFDGRRYALGAWVIMPNHLHLLVDVWETPLSKLIKSWKSFTAREANRWLGRSGVFWEREYLDTIIVDEEHRRTAVRYIENNPTRAKLASAAKDWPWSSARFQDEFGRLQCPAAETTPDRSADFQSA